MYRSNPPTVDPRGGRRPVLAGVALNAIVFAALVAVSHPATAVAVLVTGTVTYALGRVRRRSSLDRSVGLSRSEVRLCLQLRLE